MEIRTDGKVFAAKSLFIEKEALKTAGFWWHNPGSCLPNCAGCASNLGKTWYTTKLEIAVKLRSHFSKDPDQQAKFAPMLAAMDAAISMSHAKDNTDIEIPVPEGLAYLPYQRAGIAYAATRKATLIADEMGLGKTVQTLGFINLKMLNAPPDYRPMRVLTICRKSLRLNWCEEARKWLVNPRPIFLPDTLEELQEAMAAPFSLVIINHDKLKVGGKKTNGWTEAIMKNAFDLLVIDETQDFKTADAQRTCAVLGWEEKVVETNGKKTYVPHEGIRHKAAVNIYCTGTPIENRPLEIHTIASALDPQFKGFGFLKRYCGARQVLKAGRYVWEFNGATNSEELGHRLRSSIMVRRLKKDVLKELPPKTRRIVPLNQTAEMKGLVTKLKELAKDAGIITDYHADLASLEAGERCTIMEISRIRHELALLKVPQVVEFLQQGILEEQEKIILFAHHKDVVAALATALAEYGVVTITGDTPEEERHANVKAFQTGTPRIFIGNIKAAGVGLTLTRASYVGMVELSWNPAEVCQAEDRAHRIGQLFNVMVDQFVVDKSLEVQMARSIVKKLAMSEKILDSELKEVAVPVAPPKKTYAPIDEETRKAVHDGLKHLAALCDGATAVDGMGFNKMDTNLGKDLAYTERLSDGQAWLGAKMLVKYKRQLPEAVLSVLMRKAS